MTPNRLYVGRRVKIRNCDRYGSVVNGQYGTIRVCYSPTCFAVTLDNMRNENSRYGYFHFDSTMLEFIDETEEVKGPERSTNMLKIEKYLNTAVVKFLKADGSLELENSVFNYANFDPDLHEGNLCVVMTAHHGMSPAYVVEIKPDNDVPLTREIVARIDPTAYFMRVEQRKKAAELKEKMQARAKQLQDISLFKLLAADDPEMKRLLDEYLGTVNV